MERAEYIEYMEEEEDIKTTLKLEKHEYFEEDETIKTETTDLI